MIYNLRNKPLKEKVITIDKGGKVGYLFGAVGGREPLVLLDTAIQGGTNPLLKVYKEKNRKADYFYVNATRVDTVEKAEWVEVPKEVTDQYQYLTKAYQSPYKVDKDTGKYVVSENGMLVKKTKEEIEEAGKKAEEAFSIVSDYFSI